MRHVFDHMSPGSHLAPSLDISVPLLMKPLAVAQKGHARSNSTPTNTPTSRCELSSNTLESQDSISLSLLTSPRQGMARHRRHNTVSNDERSAARANLFVTLGERLRVLDEEGTVGEQECPAISAPVEQRWHSSAENSAGRSKHLTAVDGPEVLSTSACSATSFSSLPWHTQLPLTKPSQTTPAIPISEQPLTTPNSSLDDCTAGSRQRTLVIPNQWKRRGIVIGEDDDVVLPLHSTYSGSSATPRCSSPTSNKWVHYSSDTTSIGSVSSAASAVGISLKFSDMESEEPEEIVYSTGYPRRPSHRDASGREISWVVDPVLESYITNNEDGEQSDNIVDDDDQIHPESFQEDFSSHIKRYSPRASLCNIEDPVDEQLLGFFSQPRTLVTATSSSLADEDSNSSQRSYPQRLSVASPIQCGPSPPANGFESDNSLLVPETPPRQEESSIARRKIRWGFMASSSNDTSQSRASSIAPRERSRSTDSSVSWRSGRSVASPKVGKIEPASPYSLRGQQSVMVSSSASSSMQSLALPSPGSPGFGPFQRSEIPYLSGYDRDVKLFPFPGIKNLEKEHTDTRNRRLGRLSISSTSVLSLHGKEKVQGYCGNRSSISLDIEQVQALHHRAAHAHLPSQHNKSVNSLLQSVAPSSSSHDYPIHGQIPNGQSSGAILVGTPPTGREALRKWLRKRFRSSTPTLASNSVSPTSPTVRSTLHSKKPSLSERLGWRKENILPSDSDDIYFTEKPKQPTRDRTLSLGESHMRELRPALDVNESTEAAITKADQWAYDVKTTLREAIWQVAEEEQRSGGEERIGSTFPGDLSTHITRDGEFPVAAGGSADIYKGMLVVNQMEVKVAIKTIKVYSVENNHPKKTKRLRREMKVWMKLNHANVLSLFGTTSGFGPFPAMVCPWLENGTLTSYVERCGADLEILQILALIHDVASGLQYLHSQSVVHGDLSGSNVLIDANGRACIADFGLSTVLDEIGGSTFATSSTGKARGTLRWAAPELLDLVDYSDTKTQHAGPTIQSDIYSFGGIMLQILSGKLPYHYYSRDMQVVAAICRGETPTRPDSPHVTDHRWDFIQRCWSPARMHVQRPSSAEIVAFSNDDLVWNSPQAF